MVEITGQQIFNCLTRQAEIEAYGEGTVTITGPVDLEELGQDLAHYVRYGYAP